MPCWRHARWASASSESLTRRSAAAARRRPDVGTAACFFAAALHQGPFRSLVVGTGGAAVLLQLGSVLKEWVEAPSIEPYRKIDGSQFVTAALGTLERYSTTKTASQLGKSQAQLGIASPRLPRSRDAAGITLLRTWRSCRRPAALPRKGRYSSRFFTSVAKSSNRRRGITLICTCWPCSFMIGRSSAI